MRDELVDVLDDDFNTPDALALFHDWRDAARSRVLRGLELFGLGSLATGRRAPADVVALAEARREARVARTSPRRTACAPRSKPRAGRCATSPRSRASSSSRAAHDPRARLRAHAVREAVRGPREVLELWATDRAAETEDWLADAGVRVQVRKEKELSDVAKTRDHQGLLAWCEPYRYADAWELAVVEAPLLVCLDQVTNPRNLGAVARALPARARRASSSRRTGRRA